MPAALAGLGEGGWLFRRLALAGLGKGGLLFRRLAFADNGPGLEARALLAFDLGLSRPGARLRPPRRRALGRRRLCVQDRGGVGRWSRGGLRAGAGEGRAGTAEKVAEQIPAAAACGLFARLLVEGGVRRRRRRWRRCRGAIAPGRRRWIAGALLGTRILARGCRGDLAALLTEASLLIGGRALAQTVGAVSFGKPALEPERTGEIGDGLGGLLLLPVGDAAQQQGFGHEAGRQVAGGQRRAQRLHGLFGLTGLKLFAGVFDGALRLGGIVLLFAGCGCGLGGRLG